jgi:hypothetical protein
MDFRKVIENTMDGLHYELNFMFLVEERTIKDEIKSLKKEWNPRLRPPDSSSTHG